MKFKTSMLRSYSCNYSDAYIFETGNITAVNENDNDNYNTNLAKKNHHLLLAFQRFMES